MNRRLSKITAGIFLIAAAATYAQVALHSNFYTWAAASSAGTTQYIDLHQVTIISARQTVDVALGAGANSVCTWQLEGSNDLVNWYSLSGSQDCTAVNMVHVIDRPTIFVRINVLAYTGNATLTFHWVGI